MSSAYQGFVERASALLLASGGQQLIPLASSGSVPEWSDEWDRVILLDAPGAQTIFAFSSLDGRDVRTIRNGLDNLVQGLSTSGSFQGPPIRIVFVVASERSLERSTARSLVGMTPSSYYTNLRPTTWAVDLATSRILTPGLRTPEAALLFENALRPDAETLDDSEVERLRTLEAARNRAFYALMRGRQPVVTYALIALNVTLFALVSARGGADNVQTLLDYGALSPRLIGGGEWWRLCTTIFLHASVAHILFNMTSLFAVGTLAERLYGSVRYLAIYLGSGLLGSVASYAYAVANGHPNDVGVGASGAIFGVAAALVTIRFQHSEVIPDRLRRRISSSMLPLVGFSLVFALLTPHVDNSAHLGGLVGGAVFSFLFPLTGRTLSSISFFGSRPGSPR